ncbi:pantoate--beta-alanine ligase [Parvularcula marina]|uniref:Pantothenate synthetase n=1 Tax=Parvularcula marina TaxID=2292771 RepID=A0A371RGI2_9PROT|nr:pantoate--beta-alanine ligase [Parvularcula marina]RFB04525.1 pantoate--beta-alanine ligase [Parvularcula marina]
MNTHTQPPIARHTRSLAAILGEFRKHKERIAFVPTMGALHRGHLSLVEVAKAHAERVVVSIFVNPKQFAPTEDLDTYPRTELADVEALSKAGVDAIYMPDAGDMYPEGYQTTVTVPEVAKPLDGASRGPGYFAGIATVVLKLFNQVRPDAAVFGEKDYQQLLVIRRMVRDLNLDIDIIGAPIIRESDGLAMSSRNQYLSDEERNIAGWLSNVMRDTTALLRTGADPEAALAKGIEGLKSGGLAPVDYFELRRDPTLELVTSPVAPEDWATVRLFAAVMLGRTRLIDNMAVSE